MSRRNPFPGVGNQPVRDRHGKKRWRLRRTINGRKIDAYLHGLYGSAQFRAEYHAALNPGPEVKIAGALGTFDDVVTRYRGNASFKRLAKTTRYAKGKRLDWIRGKIGAARLTDLKVHHIENLMDRKGGPDAANRLVKELSELFTFARKKLGMDLPNPTISIDRRKTNKSGFHSWTEQEVQQYREAHPSGTKPRLALELMIATGAARQDACAMGRHSIKGKVIYYRRGKTGQEAELPWAYMPELVAEIMQLPRDTNLFLTHSGGKPYTPESFGNWFRDQCEAAGLPSNCRAHGLRKYGATRLAEEGANELHIMAFLAHSNTRESLRYIQSANRKKLAAAGMAMLYPDNVSNLEDWLGKAGLQVIEKKERL